MPTLNMVNILQITWNSQQAGILPSTSVRSQWTLTLIS